MSRLPWIDGHVEGSRRSDETARRLWRSHRLPLTFDVTALRRDLACVGADDWSPVPVLGVEAAIPDWTGSALRSHDGSITSVGYQGTHYHDTPLLERAPYFAEVTRFFACETRRVRLLTLHPGAEIGTHRDALEEDGVEVVRVHVPITTNDRVSFLVDGQALRLLPGEAWFVDVSRPHSVANHGETPRVHLVLDCVVNAWVNALLSSEAHAEPTPSV
ncbi:MAG: hypothetical protein EB084_13015 [Proteobacteria bacterium]|nr:hypothetical protein [Pseudomonadota bacterium]